MSKKPTPLSEMAMAAGASKWDWNSYEGCGNRDWFNRVPAVCHHYPGIDVCGPLNTSLSLPAELRCEDQIDSLEATWKRLLPENESPFQTFSWNQAWLKHFIDEVDEVLLFVLSSGGQARAILPCYRDGNEIRLIGDRTCDFQEVISRDEEAVATLYRGVLKWLERDAPNCFLVFDRLREHGMLYGVVNSLAVEKSNFLLYRKRFFPCPYIELSGGLDGYLKARSSKIRGDRKRALKRLKEVLPDAEMVIHRAPEIPNEAFDLASDFHTKHFRKGGVSPLGKGPLREALREVSQEPEAGLQLATLVSGNEILAMEFGFARGNRFHGFLTVFNPAFSHVSPGKCSILLRIDEWVEHDGIEVLDFLAGSEGYKKGYTDGQCYWVSSIQLLPKRPAGYVRYARLELNRRSRGVAKWGLKKLGLR